MVVIFRHEVLLHDVIIPHDVMYHVSCIIDHLNLIPYSILILIMISIISYSHHHMLFITNIRVEYMNSSSH